jgi:hypothetical protein
LIAVQGRAKRPSGASSSGPRPGTVVAWRLAQPIIDLAQQAEALGWPILGIVGNTEHLRKHGDHTPWSRGKTPGVIYAIDVHPPAGFEAYYVAQCRRADYDTRWIDFININGRQFNAAGVKVANSSDEHLHISVAKGHEDTHVTLFGDYAGGGEELDAEDKKLLADTANTVKELRSLLHDGKRFPLKTQTHEKGKPIAWIVEQIGELRADVNAIRGGAPSSAPPVGSELAAWPSEEWIDRVAARVIKRVTELRLVEGP